MSEVQSRPVASRGRGSARGSGRGGHSSRGGRGGARTTKPDSSSEAVPQPSVEEEGEIGQLKKKHASGLSTIKELFADWTDEDLVFALEDANGDLEVAIERITEGNVSQWGEVKKKHNDRSRTKPKEAPQPPAPTDTPAPASRGGRGRGGLEGRGRARGDRSRGRGGRAGAHVNGTRTDKPSASPAPLPETTPTAAASAEPGSTETGAAAPTWGQTATATKESSTVDKPPQKSSIIPEGSKKGWSSLFAKPTPPPPQKKPPQTATTVSTEPAASETVEPQASEHLAPQPEVVREQPPAEQAKAIPTQPAIPEIKPKDELPSAEATVKAQELAGMADPTVVSQQRLHQQDEIAHQRATSTGYSAASYKAGVGAGAGRGPNVQRRVLEQQEAVVMPGNHAVDRAAVQFGSIGLNGSVDDVDEEREAAETRPQPPQHSPVAPRASLPPSTQAHASSEGVFAPRPAPGLPPVPPGSAGADPSSLNDLSRYGEAQQQKQHYDPFGQQVDQSQPQVQEPFSAQTAMPSHPAATTAADYSAFYGAGADQARQHPYYYGAYGQQPQEAAAAAHRFTGGFGGTGVDAQQPHMPVTQPLGRYGHVEAPNSGQNTPNPILPGQAQPAQPSSQHVPQAQGATAHGAYNYGYPYYTSPHYPASYMAQQQHHHQYGRNRPMYDDARRYEEQHYFPHTNQFGYGNQFAPYAKGGMYGQPQHGFSYEQQQQQHSSSPANAAAFNQAIPGREAAYGRAGSAQPSEGQQPTASNALGSMTDVFGRGPAGLAQNQAMAPHQQQTTSADESVKGFEASKAGGPSPSVTHANRPGSATNSVPIQPGPGQTGLPPIPAQQMSQQGFGGYPHLNPQYGGLGGLGTHQQQAAGSQAHHQGGAYGGYAAGFGGNYYANTGRGGGWGGNYGH